VSDKRFTLSNEVGAAVLEFDNLVIVGRAPSIEHSGVTYDVTLQLDHTTVSSNHASLAPAADGLMVTDLGSTNGTFINHQRLTAPTLARGGDEIRFDTHTLILADEQAKATQQSDSDAVDPGATVVRSVAVTEPNVPPEDNELADAEMGQTVVLAVNKDLPRSWQIDSPGTVILKPGAADEQFAIDADALAIEYQEPTLVLLGDSGDGQPISLRSEGDLNFWNIGKNGEKHELSILLEDPSVSDFHAKLVRRGDKWSIHDQMSTNKTRVNGEIVLKRFLASKDIIEFGAVKTLLLLPSGSSEETTGQNGSADSELLDAVSTDRWKMIAAIAAVVAVAIWLFVSGVSAA